jgi:hypothetical protein
MTTNCQIIPRPISVPLDTWSRRATTVALSTVAGVLRKVRTGTATVPEVEMAVVVTTVRGRHVGATLSESEDESWV